MGAWESGPEEQPKKSWREIVKEYRDKYTGPNLDRGLEAPGPRPPKPQGKQHDEHGRLVFEHDEIHHLSITENKHVVVGIEPCDVLRGEMIELHPFGGEVVMLVNYIDGPKPNAAGKELLFVQGWPVVRGA